MNRWIALVAAAGAVVAIALTFRPVVEADGVGYFSYLHSVLVDRDLDLSDEYRAAFDSHVVLNPELFTVRTQTGLTADYFPVGPALLSAPAYATALALHPDGRPVFGPPFTTAFTLASLFFGLLALAIAFRLSRAVTGTPWAAALGTAALALATPFAYYLVFAPSYSHMFSAFAVGLFLVAWFPSAEDRSWLGWLGLGVLGGLMGAVRFQDGPLAAIALLDAPRARLRTLWFLPGLVAGFAPQLLVDRVLFGGWLPQRPAGQALQLFPGHYFEVLFSSYHGLLSWSPLLVAALAGGLLAGPLRWRLAFAFAFAVELVINGAAPDWWAGFAFGGRRFLDLSAFFAVGIALSAIWAGRRLAVVALLAGAAWNLLLAANLTYVWRNDRDPGFGNLVLGQLQAAREAPKIFGHGAAGRDLLWWRVLHQPARPLEGAVLVGLTALFVVAAAFLAVAERPAGRRRKSAGPPPSRSIACSPE